MRQHEVPTAPTCHHAADGGRRGDCQCEWRAVTRGKPFVTLDVWGWEAAQVATSPSMMAVVRAAAKPFGPDVQLNHDLPSLDGWEVVGSVRGRGNSLPLALVLRKS